MLPPFRPLSSSLDLQGAFAQLSRNDFAHHSLDDTLRQLTAATGRMLSIERVALWGLAAQQSSLECINLYELSRQRHSRGWLLEARRYPEYFRAVARRDPIVADDALQHPATVELVNDYLLPNGVSAVIHAPIQVNCELQGVLTVERVGPHAPWTSVQRLFSHAVANLVSLALLQHQLLAVEAELRDANSLRRALLAAAPEAILLSDARTGHILDANPQAEKLFGRKLEELLGILQSELCAAAPPAFGDLLALVLAAGRNQAVRSQIVRAGGELIPVEVSGQVVELERGRRVVQGVFRPLAARDEKA